jgi:hypothetical protein
MALNKIMKQLALTEKSCLAHIINALGTLSVKPQSLWYTQESWFFPGFGIG